ncbi:ABC transporter permease [Microbacterium invictum]|uniref:Peptide/nickel transport system permease protein n=1 Tax=Microbacterium invictum TaxID=515415 RepID=A0AA40VKS4_9MICO|nr:MULTISPECIES: ABC transporter permease [Microbacterium]MBB4138751.1 peptide/nickel transport system permease protein [Microbacterium invictum]
MALPNDPGLPGDVIEQSHVLAADERGISQGRLTLRRFVAHKPAVISAVLFVLLVGFAVSVTGIGAWPGWWKWNHEQLLPPVDGGRPTLTLFPFSLGEHPFGQNTVGKDYFAMVMRGLVNSSYIMFIIGLLASFIGVVIGAIAGYYRGWVDSVLMRLTDVVIVIPIIVIGAVVGSAAGGLGPVVLAVFLGFFAWTGVARLVRAEFLTLREREFVEAARVAGASDARIIFKHILPNAIGVVIVSTTLLIAAAVILETSLSFLGYGVRSPDVSLGLLIAQNQSAFQTRPWLFWWPAVLIVLLSLLVNFVGDGLRDAFDPRQKRVVFRKVKELPADATVVSADDAVSEDEAKAQL